MFLLQPFYPNISHWFESFLFHDQFVKRQILEKFSDSITHGTTQESLISTFIDFIKKGIDVENGVLYISKDGHYFNFVHGFGKVNWEQVVQIPDVRVVRRFLELKSHFIKEEFQEIYEKTFLFPDEKEFIETTIKKLEQAHLEIIVHFHFEDKLYGLIGLGKKLDETVYSDSDIDFLITMGNQFALSMDSLVMIEEMHKMERMAIIGQMASVVAHEVRNPLGSIEMSASLIAKEPEKQHHYISVIVEESARLKRLVSDFLDFGRPLKPNIENISLCDVIERTLKLIEKQKSMEKIFISRKFTDRVLSINGDAEYIRQIVINLIENASQSMNYNGKIEIELFQENGEAVMNIKDSGKGISEDKLKYIFEPFYTTKNEGTGLGLAIVKRLVESMQGKIQVKSKENIGTIFTVSFSCARD
jgi:signal transduction histidine kinase